MHHNLENLTATSFLPLSSEHRATHEIFLKLTRDSVKSSKFSLQMVDAEKPKEKPKEKEEKKAEKKENPKTTTRNGQCAIQQLHLETGFLEVKAMVLLAGAAVAQKDHKIFTRVLRLSRGLLS